MVRLLNKKNVTKVGTLAAPPIVVYLISHSDSVRGAWFSWFSNHSATTIRHCLLQQRKFTTDQRHSLVLHSSVHLYTYLYSVHCYCVEGGMIFEVLKWTLITLSQIVLNPQFQNLAFKCYIFARRN